MLADFDEIDQFARARMTEAKVATEEIQFSVVDNEHYSKEFSGHLRAEAPYSVGSTPDFVKLETTQGHGGAGVILSVDLRGSSKRAIDIGPKDTYLTMHTYLPTMAELVSKANGNVGGLRGDGLFAVFGLTKYDLGMKADKPPIPKTAIGEATRCAKAMLEATLDILNPLLMRNKIQGDLRIGVGISVGEIVVTNIGIGDAFEKTIYGPPVNQACKSSVGTNAIVLSKQAKDLYPTEKGGAIRFRPKNDWGGWIMECPSDFVMLKRKPRPK